jgi:hypothetical protein
MSLVLSLLFGVGQIGAGCLLVAHGRRRWRRGGVFVLMLVGIWFVCSGATELFVSGMEACQQIGVGPDTATFILWRGRADTLLAVATGIILLSGILIAVIGKVSWRRNVGA